MANPTSLSLRIKPFYIVKPGATYGLSGTLTDTRHSRPVASQRIIFENYFLSYGDGIPPINSVTTNDSGNFSVSGLRAPTTVGDYKLRARFDGGRGYDPSKSLAIALRVSHAKVTH
jgi:hypothetical protein